MFTPAKETARFRRVWLHKFAVQSSWQPSLSPVSTADLEHFYKGTAQTKEGITVLYTGVDSQVNQAALHGTVYLQCKNAACDVYFDAGKLNLGSDAQALAAMRLGLKITSTGGTSKLIFKLDGLGATDSAQSRTTIAGSTAVVSSASSAGEPDYVEDPALNISDYLEGCDEQCFDPVQNKDTQLQLAFAGVDLQQDEQKGETA